jgi:hypothetical protein
MVRITLLHLPPRPHQEILRARVSMKWKASGWEADAVRAWQYDDEIMLRLSI